MSRLKIDRTLATSFAALKSSHISTKAVVAGCLGISALSVISWAMTGKLYLDLGFSWLGFGVLGVGFFEGKLFYSSMISFAATFAISYFALVEKQSKHPAVSLIISGLVMLSAAYVFEYVYLFLNHQVLFKYLSKFHWWFNLLAGFAAGFGSRSMRITKLPVILFALFGLSMAVWYLSGYPQLADKDIPVLLYHNYTGLPVTWGYPLNALSKFLGCIATASLLVGVKAVEIPPKSLET